MDILRNKRPTPPLPQVEPPRESNPAASSPNLGVSGSPASSEGEKRGAFLHTLRSRPRRTLSHHAPSPTDTPQEAPPLRSRSYGKLSKTAPHSAAMEILNRRNSGYSDDRSILSRTPTTLSASSSSTVDWRLQKVEGAAPLEPDAKLLRNSRTPFLVVTADYVVKVKSQADLFALFPGLASDGSPRAPAKLPDPLLAIPTSAIVSVFDAVDARSSPGLEVWWRTHNTVPFRHASFSFIDAAARDGCMDLVLSAQRLTTPDPPLDEGGLRCPWEVEAPVRSLFAAEEPRYHQHHALEIFPVVPRGATRREGLGLARGDDKVSKKALDGRSFYLAVGANLCFYVEVRRGNNRLGEVTTKHTSFGLVSLESFNGVWSPHQEKFEITFRDPFRPPRTLELASRYYRQIIRVLGKADRYLKPAWPSTLQTLNVFNVAELKEPQYLVPRGNYGSIHRTLDAFTAAYRCPDINWEINWRSRFAPEFRLLPSRDGLLYSPLQLLAVLRSLRYNDYFMSLSFRGVNLSVLHSYFDRFVTRNEVGYLSRNYVTLATDEIEMLQQGTALEREFHALAFCSDTIRQIDFADTFKAFPARSGSSPAATSSVQFLSPIFNLLASGSTKCNHLLLGGNVLGPADVTMLIDALKRGRLQGLDVSRCGLSDMDLRDLVEAATHNAHPIQLLNLTGNPGRISARMVPDLMYLFRDLRDLNLYGCILGCVQGPLLPFEALDSLDHLQELDISHYKVNEATVANLETYLRHRSQRLESDQEATSNLRRLVLNNCNVTGRQAARLFDAIGEDKGIHLFLSENPLEDGVEHLAHSIRNSRGPSGLHMDMVEFRDERNYAMLVKAFTVTKHLSLLSLVGTAPTPSPEVPCSDTTLQVLGSFLAENESISYLDLSGYSGKLDDGQMARGFGRCLQGLARNRTLTHLWIRNQNLHGDAGVLGSVLRQNDTLVMFDCQDNDLNLTSLQFIIQNLKQNHALLDFPLSPAETGRIWNRVVGELQHPHQQKQQEKKQKKKVTMATTTSATTNATATSTASLSKAARSRLAEQEAGLRKVLDQSLAELEGYLDRNRAAAAENGMPEAPTEWAGHEEDAAPVTGDLGKTAGDWEADLGESAVWGGGDGSDGAAKRVSALSPAAARRSRRPTIRSSAMLISVSDPTSYQVQPGEGMESPTDAAAELTTASTSATSTTTVTTATTTAGPPALAVPRMADDEDDIFHKVMQNLKERGFECV